jgi:hypothetical protein
MNPRKALLAMLLVPALAADFSASDTRGYEVVLSAEEQLTQMYLSYYLDESRRPHVLEAFNRAERYRDLILGVLREEGLPEELFYLPMIESEYNPSAVSPVGAVGLWQLMPQTARLQGLRVTPEMDERLDPAKCTRAAVRHLKALRSRFDNWPLTLAAYNCGAARLKRIMATGGRLPRETRHFVPKFRAAVLIGEVHTARLRKDAADEEAAFRGITNLEIAMLSRGTALSIVQEIGPGVRAELLSENLLLKRDGIAHLLDGPPGLSRRQEAEN